MTRDHLRELTGHDTTYWVSRIEALIRTCEREPTEEEKADLVKRGLSADGHRMNAPHEWLNPLSREIFETFPDPRSELYDGNMRAAAILGLVLMAWYLRLKRTKAFDESRGVWDRQRAYDQYLDACRLLHDLMLDDRDDAVTFPHMSRRQNPYAPSAQGGNFR